MPLLFISHSAKNDAEAAALVAWLAQEGWDDVFLDVSPDRGISAGERWERALNDAAARCEAVLCLVSRDWLASSWCRKECDLAHRLNKRIFGLLIEPIARNELPSELTETWQLVQLWSGRDHLPIRAVLPITHDEVNVTFSSEGLQRLKYGLEFAGLARTYFAWPPPDDPNRPPYRGFRPFEAEDAGIFFGRDGPIGEMIEQLRGLREGSPPRAHVILGASGAGKSSFLRAGIIPRLVRDDRRFLPLPIVRPERSAIFGTTGLVHSVNDAVRAGNIARTLAEIRSSIAEGAPKLRPLLQELANKATPLALDNDPAPRPPMLVIAIDQAEELFQTEGEDEARQLLTLLRDLLLEDTPAIVAIFAIRSEAYERLQVASELEGISQATFSLPPMPKGSYAEVIKGPARRLAGTPRQLAIEDRLVDALLADIEVGGGRDALPLLAFTLERMYSEYGGDGDLTLAEYAALGRIKGSIEIAVERAMKLADDDPRIPEDRTARLVLLRRGLIPWLAGIDPDTQTPRRRTARQSEIPPEARPLIRLLVDQRLLATDIDAQNGEQTIEPIHEALLRQWGLLQGWLAEDAGLLSVLEGVRRASRDWAANARDPAWLAHGTGRLAQTEQLRQRADLAAQLEPTDWDYLNECRRVENTRQATISSALRRKRILVTGLVAVAIGTAVLIGWVTRVYVIAVATLPIDILYPSTLAEVAERALQPGQSFRECMVCPEMVVMPVHASTNDAPTKQSMTEPTGLKPFAVSRFEVTYDEWDACVVLGGCAYHLAPPRTGRGRHPVVNVSWNEATHYLVWLSKKTGKSYRLLSDAEWEYAAQGGVNTAYPWGDSFKPGAANCNGCGSPWDGRGTAPVGSFPANAFGLHDMLGNAWEWVQNCYSDDAASAATPRPQGSMDACPRRAFRGGSFRIDARRMGVSLRMSEPPDFRGPGLTIRVGRSLLAGANTIPSSAQAGR
jgi:formylglycine-generating enzyme required for sulfatase activity